MSTLLTLSTMVLFGWMLNSPNDDLLSPDIAPPTSSLPLPPLQEKTTSQEKTNRSALKDAQQRETQRKQSGLSRMGASRQYQQRSDSNMQQRMPVVPTDSSSSSGGGYYQWLPPTAGSAPADGADSGGRPSGLHGLAGSPNSPTRSPGHRTVLYLHAKRPRSKSSSGSRSKRGRGFTANYSQAFFRLSANKPRSQSLS